MNLQCRLSENQFIPIIAHVFKIKRDYFKKSQATGITGKVSIQNTEGTPTNQHQ